MFLPIVALVIIVGSLIPDTTLAQGIGVPCDGPDCNFCHFITLANNVIAWLIGVLAVVFGAMIFAAGFGLVTSGGNPSKLEEAKKNMTNALIGIIIVLAAWLIVDTLLKATLPEGRTTVGPWNQVQCEQSQLVGDDYVPDPTTVGNGVGEVLGGVSGDNICAVTPLTPITDSAAQQLESGSRVVFNNPVLQACANKLVSRIGGTITSAYRPQAYQNHLKEIHTKWCTQLINNTDTDCSAIKNAVSAEFTNHQLNCGFPVANTSNHSSGNAVDISPGGVAAPADTCLTWYGNGDRVHYTLKSGCSCN